MRLRKKAWAKPLLDDYTDRIVITKLDFLTNPIKDVFSNNNPLVLEIGTGKGDFITKMATNNPNMNFIGIEQNETILAIALKKVIDLGLTNIKLIRVNANEMLNIFDTKEIDVIRLNFSDPWPKSRHEDRRLTSPEFLHMYHNILNDDGYIAFKTDNREFFDYSVESFKENNWVVEDISYNYPLTNNEFDVPTEYERKFRAMGTPINFIKVKKELKK